MSTVERIVAEGLANGEADIVAALAELHERLAKVEGPTPVKRTSRAAATDES